ncbi:uncharacterized protein LOC134325611 [Trichomycterus rosablanca]|uniref:uncharacterized protein LOC134325611 n=1 Tax=Trichomycterus rosablanca TaxID=2290929 RepID=UPI002F35902E
MCTVTRDSSNILSENQLLCPICMDVFTDPVTTSCGHNFCRSCLTQHWDKSPQCHCPICKEKFTKRPELKINTTLREAADPFKKKSEVDKPEVLCDVCTGEKQKALRSCLDCGVTFCESHLEPHNYVPNYKKHKLINPVKNLGRYRCQKHEKPFELFCRDDQIMVCQFCTLDDHKNHNIIPVKEMIYKNKLRKKQTEMQQMIQDRLKKSKYNEDTKKEKSDSIKTFTDLIHSIEKSQAETLKMMEEKQKVIENQAEQFIKDLEQEITELQRRETELQKILNTEEHLNLLQIHQTICSPLIAKNWTDISINTDPDVRNLIKSLSQLQNTLDEMLRETVSTELKRIQQYAVDMTLDPDTAHPNLVLSADGQQVTHRNMMQNLPDTPKRFTNYTIVLGKQSFSSGQFYFEVQVSRKTEWSLGVISKSVNRKGKFILRPQDGFWAVVLRNRDEYKAFAGPSVLLFLKEKPQKVGVFVDYEEGLVSFYDVENRVHIYSYTGQMFTKKLYPFFSPGNNDGVKNSAPLIINPVIKTPCSFSSFLSEDQFQCSICLDVFTDPVTTPCGHNFCINCLTQCWNLSPQCYCPLCKEKFTKRPELKINTTLREVADHFRMKCQVDKPKVLCDSCTGEKQKALRSCLDCGLTFCKSHLEPHHNVLKLRKHKLINPVKNLEDYICQKHEKPFERFCRDDQTSVCQICCLDDHKNHNIISIEKETGEKKTQLGKTLTEVQQMIKDHLKKIQEIRQSVEFSKKTTKKEKTDRNKVFTDLIRSIKSSQAELREMMEKQQTAIENQAERFIKDLQQEITELKRRETELQQLLNTEEHLNLLQVYPTICSPPTTKNWTDISINTDPDVETLRTSLSQLQKTLNEKLNKTLLSLNEKLRETELKRIQQYAVDVTLDPDTAYPNLVLSDDEKQVTYGNTEQNLPDTPKRFTRYSFILAKQSFSSGRFYYEVQVSGKTQWNLGVARESVNRKGRITLRPQEGFWTVILRNRDEYKACADPSVLLTLKKKPQKVGVFVDYEEGLVSFYDVENRSHIYSYTGQIFTEKLYPYFCPFEKHGGKNSAPLIITPVINTE